MSGADWLPAITGLLAAVFGAAGGFAGATVGSRVTARLGHRGWLRDRRANIYEQYADALQAVADLVRYDDRLNYRLGNEMHEETVEVVEALDSATAALGIYASADIRAQSQRIRSAFQQWSNTDLMPTADGRIERADPLNDGYPWDRIEAAEKQATALIDSILDGIRQELGVDP